MKITLAHGSNATPENPLDFKFQLFDYTRVNEKSQDKRINNGIDGNGPGIYTVAGERAWEFANGYAGNEGEGTTFGLEVDVQQLANEQGADHIPEDMWGEVISTFIAARHKQEGFNREGVVQFFESNSNKVDDMGRDTWLSVHKDDIKRLMGDAFSESDLSYVVDYIVDDPDSWEQHLSEYLDTCDPASAIFEEGGPQGLPSQAIDRSEHLWETLQYIWRACAVEQTGRGEYTYNETFYTAMKAVIPDDLYPKAARVDQDVYVIFDMDAIDVKCAQRETFSPETITKVNAVLETVIKIKPITDKYSVQEGAVAIMAEVEKQHDVILTDATAQRMAMARTIDDYIVKICREEVGIQVVDDFEVTPGSIDQRKGIMNDEPDIDKPSNKRTR